MSELLEMAIEAHGGLHRWNGVGAVKTSASITGVIWTAKGQYDVLKDVVITAQTDRQRLTMEILGLGKRSIFEPGRIVIQNAKGEFVSAHENPRRSFEGQTMQTPWEDVHVAYFSGEAMWTYLTVPFLFAQPGFETEEVAPVQVEGETWRRLRVKFPERIVSHTKMQMACFGPDGLLKRHDYTVDVLGGAQASNYAYEYRKVDGIVFPVRRRVVAYEGDYRPVMESVLVAIDLGEITLL